MPVPQTGDLSRQFQSFIQHQALAMRADDRPPETLEQWERRRSGLRQNVVRSLGGFPTQHCDLNPQKVGELQRDGYRVEKLVLQTRPGILMTANAYVPDGGGRRPAVLCVHGHWRLAKSEPVVQARCIGLAKLGFFVLMVDAFGAGERGIGKPLGEYHGEMVAATLLPTGLTLAGLQVYENMRAVDYLQTREEVDPHRIGITGCSGGGNQTMYAGALENRFRCVVPVCSVGTYQAYLSAACCMCEVVPGALAYTEESGILSLVAPRALMIINATRDGFQFSIGEAKKSIAAARPVFDLYGKADDLKHATFDWKHDYHQPMREAMYGWMTKHLKGEGDGSPLREPAMETEEAETLRCFPGESRPDDFVTLPMFAAAAGRAILKRRPRPDHIEHWQANAMLMRESLPRVLGLRKRGNQTAQQNISSDEHQFRLSPEDGVDVSVHISKAPADARGTCLMLDLEHGTKTANTELAGRLQRAGWRIVAADLRATASTAYANDRIGRAPDHNSAEWSLWTGRPLLGQWVDDVRHVLDAVAGMSPKGDVALVGTGPASLVALSAGALDSRVTHVATVGGLTSFVSDEPYTEQRLGTIVPGILRDAGDVAQLAALLAPRRLVVAGGVSGGGKAKNLQELKTAYAWTRAAYQTENAAAGVQFCLSNQVDVIVEKLK